MQIDTYLRPNIMRLFRPGELDLPMARVNLFIIWTGGRSERKLFVWINDTAMSSLEILAAYKYEERSC